MSFENQAFAGRLRKKTLLNKKARKVSNLPRFFIKNSDPKKFGLIQPAVVYVIDLDVSGHPVLRRRQNLFSPFV